MTLHIDIKNEPYTATRIETGWQITPASSPTDRFGRSYWVQTTPEGKPLSCSCPDAVHRKNFCKHLKAVEVLWLNDHPEEAKKLEEAAVAAGF